MGATTFMTRAKGNSAKEAFDAAVAKAKYQFGHGGYTGTIAEKRSYTEFTVPKGADPEKHAITLLDDPRVEDKWGDAGCIKCGPKEYLFFGWASY